MANPHATNHETNGAPLLGEIVTWDMTSSEVTQEAVLNALNAAQLSLDVAGDLRATAAFNRACKSLKEDRAIDKIKRNGSVISFQFTRKHLVESQGVIQFDREARVMLDTETGRIQCDESHELEKHAQELFDHATSHRNTSDVTRMVQKLFANHADLYPINPRKGVAYFVPHEHRHFAEKCEHFLNELGGQLLRFPVPKGTAEGNRSVRVAVEEGLAGLLHDLEAAAEDWSETTRTSTMDAAIERWKQIKHKAESYAEYLGDRQATLLDELTAAKGRLAERIATVEAEKATADGNRQPLFT